MSAYRRLGLSAALLVIACLLVAACGRDAAEDDRLLVVTTVAPLRNIIENVGGDRVRIIALVPEGREQPHFRAAAFRRGRHRARRPDRGQRPQSGAADARARGGEPPQGHADRAARRLRGEPRGVRVRLLLPALRRQPQPAPLDRAAPRCGLCGDRSRRAGRRGPRRGGRLPRKREAVHRPPRRAGPRDRGRHRNHPGEAAQAESPTTTPSPTSHRVTAWR